jgi:anti-anti-sigma factor
VDLTVRVGTGVQADRRIELDGEYDLSRKDELTSIFASLEPDGPATIDLTKVSYVDSTFLHVLATLHFRLKEHGVTLVGANSQVRRLLSIVKFDQLFQIADS